MKLDDHHIVSPSHDRHGAENSSRSAPSISSLSISILPCPDLIRISSSVSASAQSALLSFGKTSATVQPHEPNESSTANLPRLFHIPALRGWIFGYFLTFSHKISKFAILGSIATMSAFG